MFDLHWKSIPASLLVAVVPFALACDTGDSEGQPGMEEQPPAQQGQQAPQGQQSPQGQQAPAPGPGQAQDLSDEEIETFADVYIALDEVRVETQGRLEEAGGQEEQAQIQQEASTEMEGILEEHGMTIQEYQRIAQAIELDPEQRQQFVEVLEEKGGSLPQPPQQQP